MEAHTIRDFDPDSSETLALNIQKSDEFVSVKETINDENYREVLIELTNGTLCIRAYPADSDTPVMIRLPETGGIEINQHDYDVSRMPEIEMLYALKGGDK